MRIGVHPYSRPRSGAPVSGSPPSVSPAAQRIAAWLNVAVCTSPSPSSDGDQILFLNDEGGKPELWSVPTVGGTTRRLFGGTERVGAVLPSPSTSGAIVAVDRGGDEHWQLEFLPDVSRPVTGSVPLTDRPKVIHSPGGWRDDGSSFVFTSNSRDPRFFDVHELTVGAPAHPQLLWPCDGWCDVVDVRGGEVLVVRRPTNLDGDLWVLGPGGGRHLNPHEGEQTVASATLAGGIVYAATNPGREFCALARYRPGAANHEFLRQYDGDLEMVRASPDGRWLALVLNRAGWSDTRVFEIATGEERALNSGPRGVVGSIRWLPDSSGFVYDMSSHEGIEIFRRLLATGKERRLAASSRPVPLHLPAPRLASFAASDGVTIPYWEYVPLNGKAKGCVLWIHGGPEGQARPAFSPTVEFLVGEGWRVVAPNVRGSTGYGRTFVHLDDVDRRLDSVRDLAELVQRLVREGKGSPGKFGIVGGSYGGFMVLAATSRYPELWGAAVDLVGIANFVTFLEETGPWRRALREAEYGSLAHDRELLTRLSPIHMADQIRAALLVIHGRNDPRVPLREAEQIVGVLKELQRDVELLVFDDEGHGIVRRPNRVLAWSRAVEFLEQHLLDGPAGGPG
jgi:pimeloyl-ACP methyl ester carboxylesterase